MRHDKLNRGCLCNFILLYKNNDLYNSLNIITTRCTVYFSESSERPDFVQLYTIYTIFYNDNSHQSEISGKSEIVETYEI